MRYLVQTVVICWCVSYLDDIGLVYGISSSDSCALRYVGTLCLYEQFKFNPECCLFVTFDMQMSSDVSSLGAETQLLEDTLVKLSQMIHLGLGEYYNIKITYFGYDVSFESLSNNINIFVTLQAETRELRFCFILWMGLRS